MNHHWDNLKTYVCKKSPGDTGPITDPPTPAVEGYCPEGCMPVRKFQIKFMKYSKQFNVPLRCSKKTLKTIFFL